MPRSSIAVESATDESWKVHGKFHNIMALCPWPWDCWSVGLRKEWAPPLSPTMGRRGPLLHLPRWRLKTFSQTCKDKLLEWQSLKKTEVEAEQHKKTGVRSDAVWLLYAAVDEMERCNEPYTNLTMSLVFSNVEDHLFIFNILHHLHSCNSESQIFN